MTLLQSVLLKSSKTHGNLPVCNPSYGQDLQNLAPHISSSCVDSTLPDCATASQVQDLASQAYCADCCELLFMTESQNSLSWKGPTSKFNSWPCTGQSQESYQAWFWLFSSVPRITSDFLFFPSCRSASSELSACHLQSSVRQTPQCQGQPNASQPCIIPPSLSPFSWCDALEWLQETEKEDLWKLLDAQLPLSRGWAACAPRHT